MSLEVAWIGALVCGAIGGLLGGWAAAMEHREQLQLLRRRIKWAEDTARESAEVSRATAERLAAIDLAACEPTVRQDNPPQFGAGGSDLWAA